jgi:hypothetical protein
MRLMKIIPIVVRVVEPPDMGEVTRCFHREAEAFRCLTILFCANLFRRQAIEKVVDLNRVESVA